LTKIIQLHRRDWVSKLLKVVWAYRTTWKTTTRFTHYELVYSKTIVLPIEFEYKTLRTAVDLGMDLIEAQKYRLKHLNALDEIILEAIHHIEVIQKQRIKWHDKYIKTKEFTAGDWALLYDSRYKVIKGKIQSRWLGPYEIQQVFPNGAVQLQTIDEV